MAKRRGGLRGRRKIFLGLELQFFFTIMFQDINTCTIALQLVFAELLKSDIDFLKSGDSSNLVRNRLMKEVPVPLRKYLHLLTTIGACGGVKRERKGYTELPGIVLWNLRGDLSFPARHSNRVTVVNGYSNDSLAALLERDVVPLLEHLVGLVHRDHVEKSTVSVEIKNNEEITKLLPHEIVASLTDKIYGISRDMNKMQKDICVSMGLSISELGEEPWKGKIVTSGDDPRICMIQGSCFRGKIEFIRKLDYSKVENIKRVFDKIFEFTLAEKINQKNMPQKIFVFTDLGLQQVSACLRGMWGSYRRRRGCTTLLEIVFWNLRGETGILNFPARNLNRVTMVNGFSNDSLAALLERDVVPTLEDLMGSIGPDNAISGDLYGNLLV
ncbi:hypothetical protein SADUNF_Sadunf09G0073700 [Salix dunnii]|uniref:DUF7788 domain-containing protein n=1 Tax=Salix dunnii TaxID=1413687 RepID=A0A835JW06_9ROSI|nr:hypothetical protein SADUNF_Sadunf09G0073700 [Salix dunnii]